MNSNTPEDNDRTADHGASEVLEDPRVLAAIAEYQEELDAGRRPERESFLARYPDVAVALAGCLDALDFVQGAVVSGKPPASNGGADIPVRPAGQGIPAGQESPASAPQQIGRYRVEGTVGEGGFGCVYLAYDGELSRRVAIKVPHPNRTAQPKEVMAFLAEARTVANLDHPHIVPVYDVGSTEDCPCFIVSKFIEGSTLADRIADYRSPEDFGSLAAAVSLVAAVAEALHYAHGKGLVHRDIKPGNILLDKAGQPYVADFGLALKEEDFGTGPRRGGTPSYMSPEQARGEGHRVDGRTDIFSLGVVFYELLTGRRPFKGNSVQGVLDQIVSLEVRPPRQVKDGIPKELERICLKALSKRASERYSTAKDMADDLRHYSSHLAQRGDVPARSERTTMGASASAEPSGTPIRIVPKGLRSFDAHDADFFLELLPGPRDREGLPESIRFWKSRIEEMDHDRTFSVGLLYGPSGCGKSSLVNAGLLPCLSRDVITVHVEASAADTEARLLKGLRKVCSDLPAEHGLIETLTALRRGNGIPAGHKVLLVLDQLEQWLHAMGVEENTQLVQALRQCDGGRVQCLVLVRDDFGMAATRLMAALDIAIVQGHNFATVDLFDPLHGRKVLAAFGRAFGRLPDNLAKCTKEQDAFLDQAIAGLAQEGKVISVRLALFAEMVKGKPWTPATLREVGGTAGVGVTFLEETFAAASAPPPHRLHQKAAQEVLKSLLPETGADIKGHMRSHAELLEASGYAGRPKDFDSLLQILDSELRLITPTESEGTVVTASGPLANSAQPTSEAACGYEPGQKYYQLTHDYLVPSLREWLTRKQKETRRGRAELRLAGRAASWNAKPENRHLPSWWEWANIRLFTKSASWTELERRMMRKAGRLHVLRGVVLVILLGLIGWGSFEGYGTLKAHALRDRLLDATTKDVPTIVSEMSPYRRWIDPLLRDAFDEAALAGDTHKQLHASLALMPVDESQRDYLFERLLDADPYEVPVIRDALAPSKLHIVESLWLVVEQPPKGKDAQRLRAACALARYDPDSPRWAHVQADVANDLVVVPAVYLAEWMESLRPISAKLQPTLAEVFRDGKRRETDRSMATEILADYAANQPEVLADLLMDADEKEFHVIFPKLKGLSKDGRFWFSGELEKQPTSNQADAKEKLAKRQANAAIALLRMGQPSVVWSFMKHSPDPTLRTYLIHRLAPLGADAKEVVQRLEGETEITIRRALVLTLGTFRDPDIAADERLALVEKLKTLYLAEPDPGFHGAAEWLLRKWKQETWLNQVAEKWTQDREGRDKHLQAVRAELTKEKGRAQPRWYVNGQGQTMVVIPGPVEFLMGSPDHEADRQPHETLHLRRLNRSYAIGAKPVTLEEFLRFREDHEYSTRFTPSLDCPANYVDWFSAAAYCNWLSKQEGILESEWCYETNAAGKPIKMRDKFLSLSGYRLPTEAEMEFAGRAGSTSTRFYGESLKLLDQYAWQFSNAHDKTWPVGLLKPNDLGLFDTYGNVWHWCQDQRKPFVEDPTGQGIGDDEDPDRELDDQKRRVVRGGSFYGTYFYTRSASRLFLTTDHGTNNVGLRVARSIR